MQQRESARDMAQGKWRGIMGKWLDEKALAGKHTTCPMCGGRDRFRMDDKGGSGTWICSHCGAGDGFHLLMGVSGMDFREAARYVEGMAGRVQAVPASPAHSQDDIREALRRVWGSSVAVSVGDPVHKYLSRRCGITAAPPSLRYHPSLGYRHEDGTTTKHPAMLAQVVSADGRALCIHRTYLTDDGRKADVPTAKKLMSPADRLQNVAVRLGRVEHEWLGIAEGIETAFCAAQIHKTGAVWSAISSGILESFNPPASVKMLVIYGDNDQSFTGQASSYKLARRITSERPDVEVRVCIPERDGFDWADEYAQFNRGN